MQMIAASKEEGGGHPVSRYGESDKDDAEEEEGGGSKKDWGFHEWLNYHQEREEHHREKQRKVFARVHEALGGADMDVSQVVIEPTVQNAWDRRKKEEKRKRLEEQKAKQEKEKMRELDDLFAQLRSDEQDPRYEQGGGGFRQEERRRSPLSSISNDDGEGGMVLDIGMDESELDDLLASLQAEANGSHSGNKDQSPTEMQSVLQELDLAANQRYGGGMLRRSSSGGCVEARPNLTMALTDVNAETSTKTRGNAGDCGAAIAQSHCQSHGE